jgi:hypothetical protein
MGKLLEIIKRGWNNAAKWIRTETIELRIPEKVTHKAIKTRAVVITKTAFFGKAIYREYMSSLAYVPKPPVVTSTAITSVDGKQRYRVFSDGSYRKVVSLGKRRITVAG